MPMDNSERFPKNAPGPFWVENGMCISCRAPEHEAPDLIASDDETGHCYFKKQPATPEETERAVRAVRASCCDAVQYCGDDPLVLQRLRELRVDGFIRVSFVNKTNRLAKTMQAFSAIVRRCLGR